MNTNNGRLAWIDNCKALTICFVIFFHESQFWNWGGALFNAYTAFVYSIVYHANVCDDVRLLWT